MKMPKGMSTAPMHQHKRLALGLPVNQPIKSNKPKTPA